MGVYRDVFLLASKVGCLEGYTYRRTDLDYRSLPNWIGNIASMAEGLPRDILEDFRGDVVVILKNVRRNFLEVDSQNREWAESFGRALESLIHKLEGGEP